MQGTSALIDWTPVLGVLLAGATVTALAMAVWVFRRRRESRYSVGHSLTLLTLFLCLDLVVFGAFTRLTDSGLGCPDWPGCYGHASPIGAHADIAQAYQNLPSGPVSPKKAWIEMLHRYLAAGVGLLIAILAAQAWWNHWRHKASSPAAARSQTSHYPASDPVNPWLSTLSLAWVIGVGLFGALTVTLKLYPAIVTVHLLGALALLSLLTVQAALYGISPNRLDALGPPRHPALHVKKMQWVALGVFALLWVQIALGGWVSTNYAVLACDTFPKCHGSWWPEMNFAEGFSVWRPLGQTASGGFIGFTALVAIHYSHRLMAYIVIATMLYLAWRLRQSQPRVTQLGKALAIIALLQLATGLANVVLNWPLLAALLHTTGAAVAVIVMTWLLCLLFSQTASKNA